MTDSNHGAQTQFHSGRHQNDGDFPALGAWVHHGLVSQPISPDGTTVAFETELDTLRIIIDDAHVSGTFDGRGNASLAEVAVLGKALTEARGSFVRSDADCDGRLEISDPILTIAHLFLGGPGRCCEAGSDVNRDLKLDLSDIVVSLNFMFVGGVEIPTPFSECGPPLEDDLSCVNPICSLAPGSK